MAQHFYISAVSRLVEPLDRTLMALLLAVLALSLTIQYSANDMSLQATQQHAIRIGIGLLALLAMAHIAPRHLRRWTPALFLLNLLLLVVVVFYGSGSTAQRWLSYGPIAFQPSELLKLTIPMIVAYVLGPSLPPLSTLRVGLVLGLVAFATWLVAIQPDLGTAFLVFAIGVSVILLAGISRWWILGFGALSGISLPFVWQYALREYQKDRIRIFFNPEADPLGSGYNVIQSKIAVGSGGLSGKGWTQSTQAQFDFLPEHSTDFIFSVYAEEFGLIGVALLIALYLAILWRVVALSQAGPDRFSQLLIGGLGLSLLMHVLVNIAMTVGHAPVAGSPLPLLSYGGSAMISTLAAFGMMMAARHYAHARHK
ncbi:MAG: rod shape-determining protein RodA [Gammaproteobacteria bacterium]|nr:rod shape-determining protein RodA [Gammaproteobacteria bacterium]